MSAAEQVRLFQEVALLREGLKREREKVEAAERAYEVARTDCLNLTEKVIPNLRAEVDAFREDAANYYRVAKEADAQQAALRARVAAAEADAARYRWLKAEHDAGYIDVLDWLGPYAGSDWDAAIDAESRIPDSAPEERT